jgi:hypothetical protein
MASVAELAELRLMALGLDQVRDGVAVFDTSKALVYANSSFVEPRAAGVSTQHAQGLRLSYRPSGTPAGQDSGGRAPY